MSKRIKSKNMSKRIKSKNMSKRIKSKNPVMVAAGKKAWETRRRNAAAAARDNTPLSEYGMKGNIQTSPIFEAETNLTFLREAADIAAILGDQKLKSLVAKRVTSLLSE